MFLFFTFVSLTLVYLPPPKSQTRKKKKKKKSGEWVSRLSRDSCQSVYFRALLVWAEVEGPLGYIHRKWSSHFRRLVRLQQHQNGYCSRSAGAMPAQTTNNTEDINTNLAAPSAPRPASSSSGTESAAAADNVGGRKQFYRDTKTHKTDQKKSPLF